MPQITLNNRIREKNIWVAASDGDLQRVQYLIEHEGLSPNVPDANTYTPMHAAASYGHTGLLEYLVSKGGDVNVTDEDGDTPLYTVETLEVAKWLVDHGAIVDRVNSEGISPAQHLEEDFPAIARFLSNDNEEQDPNGDLSEYAKEQLTDKMTDQMMSAVEEIMTRAEAGGYNPDEELTELVTKTILNTLEARGNVLSTEEEGGTSAAIDAQRANKKPKTDET